MGYVGVTLAVAMAHRGFSVEGVEIDEQKVSSLQAGHPPFYEDGLSYKLNAGINKSLLSFSTEMPTAGRDVYVITVGTPLRDGAKMPRFDMVERVSRQIASVMREDSLVVLRSTVAVGTSRKRVLPILEEAVRDPKVAFCPERTLEGKAVEEIFSLPQVVAGKDDESAARAKQLFNELTPTIVRVSNLETAEIIKLLDNAYRDTQFALANEVAEICEQLDIDAHEAITAANFGYKRTNLALPGYVGGPCLTKDPHILNYTFSGKDFEPEIIMSARRKHEALQDRIAERVRRWARKRGLEPQLTTIALLGLSFKGFPETDDLRGAPSVDMIAALKQKGFRALRGHDHIVPMQVIADLGIEPTGVPDAFRDAHVVIFMNNNARYESEDMESLVRSMATPRLFFDSWNMYERSTFLHLPGFWYGTIGYSGDEQEETVT